MQEARRNDAGVSKPSKGAPYSVAEGYENSEMQKRKGFMGESSMEK